MNIDNISQVVRSKYFAGKPAMDESLSDFQESKQNCKGPKATQKASKPKTRKVKKRIKGQKDIRTVLKGKKNELISYSKEFDTVCKKSGFDVDSEELQLAIALSKSLHTGPSDDASTSQALTTQGRIAKIKTTLKEYGFKVPESKITTTNKRKRKQRHEYKLISTTEEERHQKISSKYSQILFENLDCSYLSENSYNQNTNTPVYNIGTNLEYEYLKDNSIYYLNSLVEKSSTPGTLFKDWFKIPGRPASPILFDTSTMSFSEIVCSQDELDVILSGCIKSAQHIIANKEAKIPKADIDSNIPEGNYNQEEKQIDKENFKDDNIKNNKSIIIHEGVRVTTYTTQNKTERSSHAIEVIDLESASTNTLGEQYRSCSPDIFDDEVSCIMETSKPVLLSQGQKTKVFTVETNIMDLTECANNVLSSNIDKTQFPLSNVTKRKSHDFMEITECAVSASQGIRDNEKEIDLTTSPDDISIIIGMKLASSGPLNYIAESPDCSINDNDEVVIAGHCENKDEHSICYDHTDNTKKFNDSSIILIENEVACNTHLSENVINENDKKAHQTDMQKTPKDEIDLTQSYIEDKNILVTIQEKSNLKEKKCDTMDLTQSSNSSVGFDELPEVNIGRTQPSQLKLDDTIILNEEEYTDTYGKVKKSFIVQDDQVFDLTQAVGDDLKQPKNSINESTKLCSQSFYEDFEYDHSDNKENIDDIQMCEDNSTEHNTSKQSINIDLTQSSDDCTRSSISPKPVTASENIPNNSSLGKKDEISIDYDEVCGYGSDKDSIEESNDNDTDKDSLNLKYDSSKSLVCDNIEDVDNNNDLVSNSSQISEVFDLTDKELDYSLHKSRHEVPIDNYNIDFGGISVMDDITGVKTFKESLDQRSSKNYTLRESFLPEVYVKETEEKSINTADSNFDKPSASSPAKIEVIQNNVPIVTPNSEYIIKTDNVTPMLNYASMTTPQRNKELDKYGLKPFKRRRAIKILTHLYNQTHPVVEPYSDEDQPSPSKKARQDTNIIKNSSPKKIITTSKNFHSPLKKRTSPKNSRSLKETTAEHINVNPSRKEGNSSKDDIVNAYKVTSHISNIRGVDCHPNDWVFQKREKAKVHSCRVPLHIAFHNYVSSRQALKEAILKYEPVNIDVIHKDLVSYGHRYDPKDLLRFLDKKCITVKTTDNNVRNKR